MINILLSTYNGERFLAQQLDSILNQSYSDWRLYIRDDGSKDSTQDILRQYASKDKRITVVSDNENLGAMMSFEHLLRQYGDAEYIAFSDQDDVWDRDKISLSIEAMKQAEQQYPGKPIVVHSDLRVVDSTLRPIASSFWKYSNIIPKLLDANIYYLAISNSVTGCAMLFNSTARSCSLPFYNNAYMHDAWITLKVKISGGVIVPIDKPLISYRQHGDNTLGAVNYNIFGRSIAVRIEDAKRSYRMSHPYVFKNKLQFFIWKVIYIYNRWLYNCLNRSL